MSYCGYAQNVSVSLSPKHLKRIAGYSSGHRKIVQYYKFYARDSAAHRKRLDKRAKQIFDSTYRADLKKEKLERRLRRKGVAITGNTLADQDSLSIMIRQYNELFKDTTRSDSLLATVREQAKHRMTNRMKQTADFQSAFDRYALSGDSAEFRNLTQKIKGLDARGGTVVSSPEELLSVIEPSGDAMAPLTEAQRISGIGKLDSFRSLPESVELDDTRNTDMTLRRHEVTQKTIDEVVGYVTAHAEEIVKNQKQIGRLLTKYREFTSSSDGVKGTKRASLAGKFFRQRIFVDGNFSVISTAPFSLDLLPKIGYRCNTRLAVGVGINYRYTFGDSIKTSNDVSAVNMSYRTFINYDVNSFFAYGEWERSGHRRKGNASDSKQSTDNYFLGIGRKFLVHPKVYFTMTALYNLSDRKPNPVYRDKFQLRVGFQLSELATRPKSRNFDPNRY